MPSLFTRRRWWHPTPVLLPGKSHGRWSLVGCSPWGRWELDTTQWLHFHFSLSCLEKEMATHSSVLACRIPGMAEPGGLPSMGSHRVGHDWSNLAAAAAAVVAVEHFFSACWTFVLLSWTGSLCLLIRELISTKPSTKSSVIPHWFVLQPLSHVKCIPTHLRIHMHASFWVLSLLHWSIFPVSAAELSVLINKNLQYISTY